MANHEAPRDLDTTAFTEILRRLWRAYDGIVAAVFVDSEGESIDYCSSIDPFEAKIAAATFMSIMQESILVSENLALGTGVVLTIRCEQREFFIQRVSPDYLLVVVAGSEVPDAALRKAMDVTSEELRAEADIETPSWDKN